MPTFGFSAFLKLLSLNPRPQRREVRVRLSPSTGGYDFHRSLRLKSARLMIDGEELQALIDEASDLGNPAERRSLEAGLRQLDAWRVANPGQVLAVQSALYVSPSEEFKISFLPDFGYRLGGQTLAVHVWNTATVPLSARMTYAALALVSAAYTDGSAPDDVAVLSLPDNRLLRLSDVPDQRELAANVANNLDRLFVSVREDILGSIEPPDIRPGGSPGIL
ncbi:hypothetical protein QO010_002484 [Caulobacter ginsengisoli]|uniref:Uncharacterized protein n=1 Tax=Caulobacter ginsengisoli TaxID=400775 RepID=A0ABU0ITE9_9CAUL|nr:hypothetical protein [Caulobacter ginsengisoli]MDQ0464700.1 hypothetical protein [Caulobacter ginsengisoli]